MKKIAALLAVTLLGGLLPTEVQAIQQHEEMRAVWIATVRNLEFPKTKNNPEAQKREYESYLDRLQEVGINTVIVQVRPTADALYESEINPWSEVLTGTQGKDPGYDPLAFMIEEAHERDMAFHAWLNPYRITQAGTTKDDLDDSHLALQHPEWTFMYNDAMYYDPEVEGVKEHIEETVREIVENYNVDGIHFDDYFYPYNYPLPAGESKYGEVANNRRFHVTDMVRRIDEVIEETNPDVLFGISPFGIWKNSSSDPTGSNTKGTESYHAVFADTRTWIQESYIDYVVPQIYWEIGHSAADYETLVDWWSDEVKGTDVALYIGQGIYKDVVAKEIGQQLKINEAYDEVEGSVFFNMSHLLANRQGAMDQIKAYYNPTVKPDIEEPDTEKPETGEPDTEKPEVGEPDTEKPETGEPDTEKPETGEPETEEPDTQEPSGTIQNEVIIGTGQATGSRVNIRKGPSTKDTVLSQLKMDDKVDIFGQKDGWYAIRTAEGIEGFVSQDYISVNRVEKPIDLMIDGQVIEAPVAPYLTNSTTLVPLRVISENLDCVVDWNGEKRTIVIKNKDKEIGLTINQTAITVNGKAGQISVAPQIVNDTTMVPIRFISETLGAKVEWNGGLQLVNIEH